MVRVQIEVRSSTGSLRVPARAASIDQALRLVGANYPGASVRVVFPIDPEAFFAGDAGGGPEIASAEKIASAA